LAVVFQPLEEELACTLSFSVAEKKPGHSSFQQNTPGTASKIVKQTHVLKILQVMKTKVKVGFFSNSTTFNFYHFANIGSLLS